MTPARFTGTWIHLFRTRGPARWHWITLFLAVAAAPYVAPVVVYLAL